LVLLVTLSDDMNEYYATSIQVIIKIADTLNISIDFLFGKTSLEINTFAIKRLEDITKLNDKDKEYLFAMMDAFLRDVKTRNAYQ
jgi:hypothetical protein